MPERAELQSGQHGLDECDAANGTRVVVSHLLVLETASVLGQSAQQQSTKGDNPGGSGSAHGSSSAQTAAMAPLTFQPGALERSYWAWRVRYDLLQVRCSSTHQPWNQALALRVAFICSCGFFGRRLPVCLPACLPACALVSYVNLLLSLQVYLPPCQSYPASYTLPCPPTAILPRGPRSTWHSWPSAPARPC